MVGALCSLFVSCQEDVYVATVTVEDPIVTDFYPESGEVGTEVTIYGENLHITKSVTIGGGDAPIIYRISDTEIVVEVSTDTRSGGIEVVNNFGTTAAYNEKAFTITYATPSVNKWSFPTTNNAPAEGTYTAPTGNWGESSQMVVFEGANLHFVDEVQFVYTGDIDVLDEEGNVTGTTEGECTTAGTIITQRTNEIVVEIPLIDVSSDTSVHLTYFDGENDNYLSMDDDMGLFYIIVLVPQITTEIPATLLKNSSNDTETEVKLEGYNLNLINSLYVTDDEGTTIKLRMTEQTADFIIIDIVTSYFAADYNEEYTDADMDEAGNIPGFTGALYMVYNTTKTTQLASSIVLWGDPTEARYYTYPSISMSGRSTNSGGTDTPFLDLESGIVYNACTVASSAYSEVDIMFYDQSGYCNLYGAHNSTNTYKNYKCVTDSSSTDLDDLISDWASTAVGNTVKFRTLDPSVEDHAALIAAYDAGTIVKLTSTYTYDEEEGTYSYIPDEALVAAISTPATSAPKIYEVLTAYNSGAASVNEYPYLLVHRSTPDDKYGVIKLKEMTLSEDGTKGMAVTFEAIWSL